jgi:EpsI family protein
MSRFAIARLAMVGTVLLMLSAWTHARPGAADVPEFDFAIAVPLTFGGWVGRDAPPLDAAVAKVLAADQYVHRYYGPRHANAAPMTNHEPRTTDNGPRITNYDSRIEMDIAYYAQPRAGAAMHSPLNCLPGNGWQVMESRMTPVATDRGAVAVRRLVVARGSDRVAMTYWFQNRGAVIGNEYRQRLQLLTNGLRSRPTDAALVRVMALDTAAGHAVLSRFTGELASMLQPRFR